MLHLKASAHLKKMDSNSDIYSQKMFKYNIVLVWSSNLLLNKCIHFIFNVLFIQLRSKVYLVHFLLKL
ncbi:hypothetical protein KUTeg_002564 [Tegillarca granosa]|uniref:Uncharacterized protein n=1 Tax=Tegillarca granosa TaxID=220873 RepID=A0ABQ9FUM6_TEGGR|nr:hypothetical protein KUTeg_002564 [Tegillarca granosa]